MAQNFEENNDDFYYFLKKFSTVESRSNSVEFGAKFWREKRLLPFFQTIFNGWKSEYPCRFWCKILKRKATSSIFSNSFQRLKVRLTLSNLAQNFEENSDNFYYFLRKFSMVESQSNSVKFGAKFWREKRLLPFFQTVFNGLKSD